MNPDRGLIYRFDDVEIDPGRGSIVRGDSRVYLRQQALQVLQYLVRHRDRLITKQELFEAIWGDAAVTDDAVVQCVVQIRKAIGDDARTPRFVRTIPRIGYQVVAELEEVPRARLPTPSVLLDAGVDPAAAPPCEAGPAAPSLPTPAPDAVRFNRRRVFAAAVAGVLVLAGIAWYFEAGLPIARVAAPTLTSTPGVKRVAVAAFEDRAGNADLEWLQRGLPDMLASSLVQFDGVAVLGREQVEALSGRRGTFPREPLSLDRALAVAKRGNAQLLVTGAFVSTGTFVRIDARIHDVESGSLLGAESVVASDRSGILSEADILAIRIGRRIGLAARARPRKNLVEVMTDNLDAYRWYVRGTDKARELETAEAIAAFERAIAADPNFAMAYGRIGYVYALTHWEPDRARPYLEKAFKLSGRLTDQDRANIAAWYAVAHREFGGAIAAYSKIVDRYPDDLEAHWRLGYLLVGEERFEEAIAVLERGRVVDPDYPELHNTLGHANVMARRPNEAIAAYRRYVELAPTVANAHDSLGLGYLAAGDYANAVAEFERAVRLAPDFEIAIIHLGNVHFLAGRYREAIACYDRYIAAAEFDGDRSRGYAYRAWVEFHQGRAADAWRDAQRSFALAPVQMQPVHIAMLYRKPHAGDWIQRLMAAGSGNRGLRSALRGQFIIQGDAAVLRGDRAAALADYAKAAAAAPMTYHIEWHEDVLADAYATVGKDDLAAKEYERVLALHPHLAFTRYKLAQVLDRAGQSGRARAEYERFLAMWKDADPDIPAIRLARERVSRQLAGRR